MRSRGFALVIVLWTLVLLSFVITHIVATGRTEARIASNLVANADAESQADGAVMETIFRLVDASDAHWPVAAGRYALNLKHAKADVAVLPESGKVNPNVAGADLLAALLLQCGAAQDKAASLAVAIVDWRSPGEQPSPGGAKIRQYRAAGLDHAPPNAPFESLEELQRVIGMTPDLYHCLAPHLSLYQTAAPDPATSDPLIVEALRSLPQQPRPGQADKGPRTVSITAEVATDGGGHFRRRAVVRIQPPAGNYTILAWDSEARSD
jgi:general secretion pathway protein K